MLTEPLNPRIQHLQEGVIFPMTRIPRHDHTVAEVSQTLLESDLKWPQVELLSIPVRHRFMHRYHFISKILLHLHSESLCFQVVSPDRGRPITKVAWNISELSKAMMLTASSVMTLCVLAGWWSLQRRSIACLSSARVGVIGVGPSNVKPQRARGLRTMRVS